MTTHREQANLHHRLEEVLGREHAATLWAMLPAQHDLVTKGDLKEEIAALRLEMKKEIAALRLEMKEEIAALKGDLLGLRSEMAQQRRDFEASLQSFVRTFVVTQTTTVFGVAGIVFALVRFL